MGRVSKSPQRKRASSRKRNAKGQFVKGDRKHVSYKIQANVLAWV